ncbi:hypothetical protein V6N13_137691 [Hibiscus sabdariffa]
MEETTILYSSLSFIFLLFSLNLLFRSRKHPQNLPPSPPSLPILGHLHLLKPPVHRFYHSLSQKYGPVFSLRLGSRLLVVVSSSTAAEECFTKNDVVLANRPKLIMGKYFGFNYTTVTTSSYGDHWRNLRRIGAIEIFSSSRLNTFASIRKDEVRRLLVNLSRDSRRGFARVELKPMLHGLTLNNIMRMVAGKRYHGDEATGEDEERAFKELIAEAVSYAGSGNFADFLPALNWFGGYEKKVKKLWKKMNGLLQKLIDEKRRKKLENNNNTTSMIDHLLNLQQSDPHYYTDEIIKGLIVVLILAGTDTSAVTLEWAMDPKFWDDPTSFKPERFENGEKLGGNDPLGSYKLIPFGLGRRACPGAGLAQRVVGLALGAMIQCFEWERIDSKEIDMVEGTGGTMPKARPLKALCKARPIVNKAL